MSLALLVIIMVLALVLFTAGIVWIYIRYVKMMRKDKANAMMQKEPGDIKRRST